MKLLIIFHVRLPKRCLSEGFAAKLKVRSGHPRQNRPNFSFLTLSFASRSLDSLHSAIFLEIEQDNLLVTSRERVSLPKPAKTFIFQNVRLGIGRCESRGRRDALRRRAAALGFGVVARPVRCLHSFKRGKTAIQNRRTKRRFGRIDDQLRHHRHARLQRSDAEISPVEGKWTSVSLNLRELGDQFVG